MVAGCWCRLTAVAAWLDIFRRFANCRQLIGRLADNSIGLHSCFYLEAAADLRHESVSQPIF